MRSLASLLFAGALIGWLVGLSVSPTISGILGSIMGLAVAAIAFLMGLKLSPSENTSGLAFGKTSNINAWPLVVFLVGVLGGSHIGMYERAKNPFGLSKEDRIKEWTKLGLSRELVLNKMIESDFQSNVATSSDQSPVKWSTALYSSEIDADEYYVLMTLEGQALLSRMAISENDFIRAIAVKFSESNSSVSSLDEKWIKRILELLWQKH